jgi:hypothetical protein
MGGSWVDLGVNGGLKIRVLEIKAGETPPFYNPIPKDPKLILKISHVGIAVCAPLLQMLVFPFDHSALSISKIGLFPGALSKRPPPDPRSCSMRNGRSWTIGLPDATKILKVGRRVRNLIYCREGVEESYERKIPQMEK